MNGSSVNVPGAFTYTSAAGALLSAGNGQSEEVTFTPSNGTDFVSATTTVTVNVGQATPTVTVTDAGGTGESSRQGPYDMHTGAADLMEVFIALGRVNNVTDPSVKGRKQSVHWLVTDHHDRSAG